MPGNAGKCREMPGNAGKCREMPGNAGETGNAGAQASVVPADEADDIVGLGAA
jgi:hypothetical protein